MREVCDLCGARFYPDDRQCRECGTERPEPSAPAELPRPPATQPPASAVDSEPRDPAPVAVAPSQSDPFDVDDIEIDDDEVTPGPTDPDGLPTPVENVISPGESIEAEYAPAGGSGKIWAGAAVAVLALGIGAWAIIGNDDSSDDAVPGGGPPTPAVDAPETEQPAAEPDATAKPAEPDSPPAPEGCPGLDDLAGRWELATEVVTSRAAQKIGLKGFYELVVKVSGCEAHATLKKTGYTGKWYSESRIKQAAAQLVRGDGVYSFGYGATFKLRDEAGRGPDMQFVFAAQQKRLVGSYRHADKFWTSTGISGFLAGTRGGQTGAPSPNLMAQPCDVRCEIACFAPGRVGDPRLATTVDACKGTCSDKKPPRCSGIDPLPEAALAPLEGPEKKLVAHCKRLAGKRPRRACGKEPGPSLTSKRLEGAWREAQFMRITPRKGPEHVRLALQTRAGWFVSAPLVILGRRTRITSARMVARALGEPTGRRNIVGSIAAETKGKTARRAFTCRLDGNKPRCVIVPAAAVTPLPGGNLALPKIADPAIEPGVYAW